MILDLPDFRLEYIVYMEEDEEFLERWSATRDILFSFLFAPATQERSAPAVAQAS
jgi:hypothetical protein